VSAAIAVGQTNSTITVDKNSALNASSKLEIGSKAKPQLSAKGSTSIWVDGFITITEALEKDDTTSKIKIDGNITVGSSALSSNENKSVAIYTKALNAYSQDLFDGNRTISAGDVISAYDNNYYTYTGVNSNASLKGRELSHTEGFSRKNLSLYGMSGICKSARKSMSTLRTQVESLRKTIGLK
jgi:hypothetical protein